MTLELAKAQVSAASSVPPPSNFGLVGRLDDPVIRALLPGPVHGWSYQAVSCQERGWSGSSGTDPGPITPNDVTSAGVMTFRPQSASTRARFPAMAMR
jgi:hypothetical protein